MSQPKNDDNTTSAKPESSPEGGKLTAGSLRELIREEIKNVAGSLFPGGSSGSRSQQQGGTTPTQMQQENTIREQVAQALKVLRTNEQRDARDSKIDALLAEREAAKPEPEKQPVERRRVEKWMRWE